MSTSGARTYLAKVQAKDEEAKLEMKITADTTIGELLRYWDWRSAGDANHLGFLIDISLPKAEIAKAPKILPVPVSRKAGPLTGTKRLAGPYPAFDGRPPSMRVTLPAIASSSKHKTAIASVDVDDYNDAGESRVSSSKDVATLKLDPKAGFQIFVQFPDGNKLPMHIVGSNTLEKIGRSACKVLKMDFEKMMFSVIEEWGEMTNYLPYNRNITGCDPTRLKYVRDEKVCMMTADCCGLVKNSVIYANPSDPKISAVLPETQPKITGTTLADVIRSRYSRTDATKANPVKLGETPEMPGKDEAGRLSAQKDNVDQSPNDLFRITVSFLDGCVIHCEIRPSTNLRKICAAVAERYGTPFEMMRFIFENQTMVSGTPREDGDDINVLLLRAPNAAKLTAKDWGLKEGDKIYGVLCCSVCGC